MRDCKVAKSQCCSLKLSRQLFRAQRRQQTQIDLFVVRRSTRIHLLVFIGTKSSLIHAEGGISKIYASLQDCGWRWGVNASRHNKQSAAAPSLEIHSKNINTREQRERKHTYRRKEITRHKVRSCSSASTGCALSCTSKSRPLPTQLSCSGTH